jgi:GMP synthase-like glutamine amidotransferase
MQYHKVFGGEVAGKKSKEAIQHNAAAEASVSTAPMPARSRALVFISHDNRDADLAEAFESLLSDVSGGILKSFRTTPDRQSPRIY